jgi:hypothetical protein
MNEFVGGLPAPAYPFDVDAKLAKAGAQIFDKTCSGCHKKNNGTVYALEDVKTDPNRANVMGPVGRAGLVELLHEACEGTGDGAEYDHNITIDPNKYNSSWCQPNGTVQQQDNDFIRERAGRGQPGIGYKADDLRGIWVQAPYLHNGSVPTLWHMLHPDARPQKFARGNINYDREKVGFEWQDASPTNYDSVHVIEFDTTLRGQSNSGHAFGSDLSEDDKQALIEYLKTR